MFPFARDIGATRGMNLGDVGEGGVGMDGTDPRGDDALETLALWFLVRAANPVSSCPSASVVATRVAGDPVTVIPDTPAVALLTTDMGKGARPRTTCFSLPFAAASAGFGTRPTISLVIVRCSCASFFSRVSRSSTVRSSSSSFLLITSDASLDSLDSSSETGDDGRSETPGRRRCTPCTVAVEDETLSSVCVCV